MRAVRRQSERLLQSNLCASVVAQLTERVAFPEPRVAPTRTKYYRVARVNSIFVAARCVTQIHQRFRHSLCRVKNLVGL